MRDSKQLKTIINKIFDESAENGCYSIVMDEIPVGHQFVT